MTPEINDLHDRLLGRLKTRKDFVVKSAKQFAGRYGRVNVKEHKRWLQKDQDYLTLAIEANQSALLYYEAISKEEKIAEAQATIARLEKKLNGRKK